MERRKPLKRTPMKRGVTPLKRTGPIRSRARQSPQPTNPPLTNVEWWMAADGQRSKMMVDRVCRVCEQSAHSFHHVPPRSWGGLNVADAGGPCCGDGTTGCHGELEAMKEDARRAYGGRMTSDEVSYVLWLLGQVHGRYFLSDRYFLIVPAVWPVWRGAQMYQRPKVVYDT